MSRSRAARLLGISQTALDRWIEKGEIASVVTPSGRGAVPVRQLAELLAADTEVARALRQSSPFAGTLNEQERRRIIELASEHEPART